MPKLKSNEREKRKQSANSQRSDAASHPGSLTAQHLSVQQSLSAQQRQPAQIQPSVPQALPAWLSPATNPPGVNVKQPKKPKAQPRPHPPPRPKPTSPPKKLPSPSVQAAMSLPLAVAAMVPVVVQTLLPLLHETRAPPALPNQQLNGGLVVLAMG